MNLNLDFMRENSNLFDAKVAESRISIWLPELTKNFEFFVPKKSKIFEFSREK